ncbi:MULTISPECIES: hypothetical protein [unclassified Halomonas]|uniref:hypothetical protein n=1 Tax=unclassified Halomonas TaxID=2609666 RepID=UPI001146DF93|nr:MULTISPECIES: hypothetical protein [unclassified Halomonas]MCE8038159.1 hypothetical protein [Halomonas sp. MCCC 1A11062]
MTASLAALEGGFYLLVTTIGIDKETSHAQISGKYRRDHLSHWPAGGHRPADAHLLTLISL